MQYVSGLPQAPGRNNWAQTCSSPEWAAWHRINRGVQLQKEFFETVIFLNVQENSAALRGATVDEYQFDISHEAKLCNLDESELLFHVFDMG